MRSRGRPCSLHASAARLDHRPGSSSGTTSGAARAPRECGGRRRAAGGAPRTCRDRSRPRRPRPPSMQQQLETRCDGQRPRGGGRPLRACGLSVSPTRPQRLRHRRIIEAGKAHGRAGDVPAARRAFETAVTAAPDQTARAGALTPRGTTSSARLAAGTIRVDRDSRRAGRVRARTLRDRAKARTLLAEDRDRARLALLLPGRGNRVLCARAASDRTRRARRRRGPLRTRCSRDGGPHGGCARSRKPSGRVSSSNGPVQLEKRLARLSSVICSESVADAVPGRGRQARPSASDRARPRQSRTRARRRGFATHANRAPHDLRAARRQLGRRPSATRARCTRWSSGAGSPSRAPTRRHTRGSWALRGEV